MATWDIVTVGGGVGGSVLARSMAERGYRVLVIERERQFRDRVRGEFVFPWGVAEAKELGVYDNLIQAGAHHPQYWTDYARSGPLPSRDFAMDTPLKLRALCMYHPAMQEALLDAARAAGAEVRRGVRALGVEPGREPKVLLDDASTVAARLVVGADGRASMVRKWGGFTSHDDAGGNVVAGVLAESVPASDVSSICMINPFLSRMVLYFPQTSDGGRAYLVYRADAPIRFDARSGFDAMLQECIRSGFPPGLLDGARQAGPLAAFAGADSRVDHPYRDGIALIGDAAATSDPTWGQGLCLTMRDARTLRDALLVDDDWDAAAHRYAAAHDQYYAKVRTTNSWFTRIMLEPGAEADAIRARVLPQMGTDPFLLPDTIVAGPDLAPPTDEHRVKLFGAVTHDA